MCSLRYVLAYLIPMNKFTDISVIFFQQKTGSGIIWFGKHML